MAALAWDGSYFMVQTLQEGAPFMPAHRWFHWVLQEPVLWMRGIVRDPAGLSVVHGLTCAAPPLVALACCMAMLRGEFARLRIWAVAGILLVPLPGQFFLITEVTPAVQLSWILFAFTWIGCPLRWSIAVALAAGAMATLHPAAAPLFLLAAAGAAAPGITGKSTNRGRMLAWAAVFGVATVVKLLETISHATPYEHESMSPAVWLSEAATGLRYSPFPALIPVFIDLVLHGWSVLFPRPNARGPWLSRLLWSASFILGIYYAVDTGGWTSSINYRKFVLLFTVPFVLMAGLDAWRLKQGSARPAGMRIPLLYPALLFATILCLMSLSWRSLCRTFMAQLASHPERVMTHDDLPKPESDSALNHWSTTSLSLVLQGWSPKKIFINNARLQLTPDGFQICPGDEFTPADKAFKLAWLAGISEVGIRSASPHPSPSNQ